MNYAGQPPAASVWKYQADELDYGIDYYYTGDPPWLLVDEEIISSEWTFVVTDGGLEKYNETFTKTGTGLWLRSGTVWYNYTLNNRILTNANRVGNFRFEILIK